LGYVGLAQIAKLQGDKLLEIERWKIVVSKFPEYIPGYMRYRELLLKTKQFGKAEADLQILKSREPEAKDILEALAKAAWATTQYDLASARWKDLTHRFPGDYNIKSEYIQSLLDILEFEQAQSFYNQNLTTNSPVNFLIKQANIHWAQFEFKKALAAIESLEVQYPGNFLIINRKVTFLLHLYRSTGDSDYASRALLDLNHLKDNCSDTSTIQARIIEVLIRLDQKEDAIQFISKLPEHTSRKFMQLKAWASAEEGDIDSAKLIWKDILRLHQIPQVETPSKGTLRQTDASLIRISRNSIILFTVVRNERWRLPWFLSYYRSLGVDLFFFVDNNSSDGTSQYLHKQNDVHVFWTDHSYGQALSGMQWINWLVEEYGSDCWCLYIDVDEALIFPGVEKRGLQGLTKYLADNGHEAMFSFMLDMYAPGLKSTPKEDSYTDFFTDYPLFENQYFSINSMYCPYKFTGGGIRRRFQQYENQTKTPIIRGGGGIKFLASSHQITPAIITDVTGVLLHFKLAGDFTLNFAQDLVANNRLAHCKRRHWNYSQTLKMFPQDKPFFTDTTVSYHSSSQLVDIGLIKTSGEFEAGKYD